MTVSIEISDAIHRRLKDLAGPLFSIQDVIERLLDAENVPRGAQIDGNQSAHADSAVSTALLIRSARERGVSIKVDGEKISAISVPDMYQQVLQVLIGKKLMGKFDPLLPYKTSNQRFLIAKKAVHPQGNPFRSPVSFGGYHMEAHKNYENALRSLQSLMGRAAIPFEILGK